MSIQPNNKPLVTSFSMAFKRATTLTEDCTEAKKEHRQHLKDLIEKYKTDVSQDKAEGIRTAKELVEVIKLDLLLMGEATERTDSTSSPIDEAHILRLSQMIDPESPEVKALMQSVFGALNEVNDEMDTDPVLSHPSEYEEEETTPQIDNIEEE